MTDSSLAQAFLRLGSSLSASKNTSGLTQMGNKHRSKRRDRFKGWRCDSCADMITSVQAGWVEWLASEDKHGNDILKGLRLVHRGRQRSSKSQLPVRPTGGIPQRQDHCGGVAS